MPAKALSEIGIWLQAICATKGMSYCLKQPTLKRSLHERCHCKRPRLVVKVNSPVE